MPEQDDDHDLRCGQLAADTMHYLSATSEVARLDVGEVALFMLAETFAFLEAVLGVAPSAALRDAAPLIVARSTDLRRELGREEGPLCNCEPVPPPAPSTRH